MAVEGTRFANFTLLRRLAVGGMAEVYLARHDGMAGFAKHVVIKRIHGHLNRDPEFVAMFLDEARLVARLNHPNIAQVHDFGMEDEAHYLVMEHVHGAPLSQAIKRSRGLEPAHAVRIASEMCAGLQYAHSYKDDSGRALGVVHRDVSPQNVLLGYDGSVKLIDFGVAKAKSQAHETRAGALKGKYAYMAPEQARGAPFDHRADQHAVGIVLWEMLTGRALYHRSSAYDTMQAVLNQRPAPVRVKLPDLPPEVDLVLGRALAKEPEDRYESCAALQAELEELVATAGLFSSSTRLGEYVRKLFDVRSPTGELRDDDLRAKTDVSIQPVEARGGPVPPAGGTMELDLGAMEVDTAEHEVGPAVVAAAAAAEAGEAAGAGASPGREDGGEEPAGPNRAEEAEDEPEPETTRARPLEREDEPETETTPAPSPGLDEADERPASPPRPEPTAEPAWQNAEPSRPPEPRRSRLAAWLALGLAGALAGTGAVVLLRGERAAGQPPALAATDGLEPEPPEPPEPEPADEPLLLAGPARPAEPAAPAGEPGQQQQPDAGSAAAAGALSAGFLTISSEPTGASLSVDGLQIGERTAVRDLPLDPGEHTVELQLDGYRRWRQHVEVAGGETLRLRARLVALAGPDEPGPAGPETGEPEPGPQDFGLLSVETSPPSLVLLGSRELGRTPLSGEEVPVGAHQLTFVTERGRRHTRRVEVRAGRTTRRQFDLEPPGGAGEGSAERDGGSPDRPAPSRQGPRGGHEPAPGGGGADPAGPAGELRPER